MAIYRVDMQDKNKMNNQEHECVSGTAPDQVYVIGGNPQSDVYDSIRSTAANTSMEYIDMHTQTRFEKIAEVVYKSVFFFTLAVVMNFWIKLAATSHKSDSSECRLFRIAIFNSIMSGVLALVLFGLSEYIRFESIRGELVLACMTSFVLSVPAIFLVSSLMPNMISTYVICVFIHYFIIFFEGANCFTTGIQQLAISNISPKICFLSTFLAILTSIFAIVAMVYTFQSISLLNIYLQADKLSNYTTIASTLKNLDYVDNIETIEAYS